MKFGKVTLKNCGPIRELEVDLNATVVGVLGPNGSGKSSFLKWLGYLSSGKFSATEKEKIEIYVNDHPSVKKADAYAEFWARGIRGEISRSITKSGKASRSLTWENETYTANDKVSEIFADHIYKADPAAVMESCFIPQGQLANFLFGTQTEREILFSRLLMLSPVEKASTEITKAMSDLKAGTSDMTLVLDEARNALALAGEAMQEANLDLEKAGNIDKIRRLLKVYNGLRDYLRNVEHMQALLVDAETELTAAEESYDSHINDILRLSRIDTSKMTGSRSDKWKQIEAQLETQRASELEVIRGLERPKVVKDIRIKLNQLEELRKQLSTCPAVEDLSAKRAEMAAAYAKQQDLERKKLKLVQHQETFAEMFAENAKIPDLTKERDTLKAKLETAKKALEEAKEKAGEATFMLQLVNTALTHTDDSQACPLCDGSGLSVEALQAKKVKYEGLLDGSVQRLEKEVRTAESAHNTAVIKVSSAESNVSRLKEKLLDSKEAIALESEVKELPAVSELYQKLSAEVTEGTEQAANNARLQERVNHLEEAVKGVTLTTEEKGITLEEIDERIANSAILSQALKNQHKELDQLLTRRAVLASRFASAIDMVAARRKNLENAKTSLDEEYSEGVKEGYMDVTPIKLDDDTLEISFVEKRILSLQAMQSDYDSKKAVAEERQRANKIATDRFYELERAFEANKTKMELYETWDRARSILARKGLPLLYMKTLFDDVVEMTNVMLSSLNSGLHVRSCKDEAVTFEYRRDDIPGQEEVWRHQNRMSGAQRVKLCIAFVMAVQRLVIPEVGFLILDEPTTHMDEEGVAGLNEFLLSVSRIMRNSEFQILVCDHHAGLTAFDKIIRFEPSLQAVDYATV